MNIKYKSLELKDHSLLNVAVRTILKQDTFQSAGSGTELATLPRLTTLVHYSL